MHGTTLWVRWTKPCLPTAIISNVVLGYYYSRRAHGYHTPAQVLCGVLHGDDLASIVCGDLSAAGIGEELLVEYCVGYDQSA